MASRKAKDLVEEARPLVEEACRADILPDESNRLFRQALPMIFEALAEMAGAKPKKDDDVSDTTDGSVQAPDTLAPSPGGNVTSGGDTPVPSGGADGTDTSGPDVQPVPEPDVSDEESRPDQRAVNKGDPPSRSTGEKPEEHDKRHHGSRR